MLDLVTTTFRRIREERDGVTALEYGMIAALIAVVIVVGVTAVGKNASTAFNTIATAM